MKKNIYLLFLLPLLVGCGKGGVTTENKPTEESLNTTEQESESSVSTITDQEQIAAFLDQLAPLKTSVTSTGYFEYSYDNTAMNSKIETTKKYTETAFFEHFERDFGFDIATYEKVYVKGEDQKTYEQILDLQNTIKLKPVYVIGDDNLPTDEIADFATVYGNPFSTITEEDLMVEQGQVKLNVEAATDFASGLMGKKIKTLTDYHFTMDETGVVSFTFTNKVEGEKYNLKSYIVGEYLFSLAGETTIPLLTPFEHQEVHESLAAAFLELEKGNYKINYQREEGLDTGTSANELDIYFDANKVLMKPIGESDYKTELYQKENETDSVLSRYLYQQEQGYILENKTNFTIDTIGIKGVVTGVKPEIFQSEDGVKYSCYSELSNLASGFFIPSFLATDKSDFTSSNEKLDIYLEEGKIKTIDMSCGDLRVKMTFSEYGIVDVNTLI